MTQPPRTPAYPGLPPHAPGQRIGIFGGSFNPPHAGHRLVAEAALRRLGLDAVWWLVTPGNPLKDATGLPPIADRMRSAQSLADDPRMAVTAVETRIGSPLTHDTVRWLVRRCPGTRFVWIMGADSLAGFHLWHRWQAIAAMVPIAVVARPGSTMRGPLGKAGRALGRWRVPEAEAATLADRHPPAWVFLHGRLDASSSSALRARGRGLPAASGRP